MKDGQVGDPAGVVIFLLNDFELLKEEKPSGMIFQFDDMRCHVIELTGEEVPDSAEMLSVESGVGQIFIVCSPSREHTKQIKPCECLIYGSLGTRIVLRSQKDGLTYRNRVNFTLQGPIFESLEPVFQEIEPA